MGNELTDPTLMNSTPKPTMSWQQPILSFEANLILILILACCSIVYVTVLIVLIVYRREMLPIKIKSPKLMLLSIIANLFIIVAVGVI